MKPRVCFSATTPPLDVHPFGAPPADSPALRRLISLGLGALVLWVFVGGLVHAWPSLFASRTRALEQERLAGTHPVPKATLAQEPAPHLERALPVLKRALPVPGAHYPATLPDGQVVTTTWKGTVSAFSQLPKTPSFGDEFGVKEGSGTSWIWATPLGWNHPAWIDP